MRKRRLKILLFILLTPIVLLCVFLLFERIRGQVSLGRYKRELVMQGETLRINELSPPNVPDSENGAPELGRLARLIREGLVIPNYPPPCMNEVASGRAIFGFRETSWINRKLSYLGEGKVTNSWEAISVDIATNRDVLDQIRAILERSTFYNKLEYEKGKDMLIPQCGYARTLAQWYGVSIQSSLQYGRRGEVVAGLLAMMNLPRMLENDRDITSEYARIYISATTKSVLWEALQTGDFSDEELIQLQRTWERTFFITNHKCLVID